MSKNLSDLCNLSKWHSFRLAVWAAVFLAVVGNAPSARSQKPTKHHAKPPAHHKTGTASKAKTKAAAPKDTGVKVWVNTKTGVYHMPGQRWYGATQQGQYMTETEARKAGYTHTRNGQ